MLVDPGMPELLGVDLMALAGRQFTFWVMVMKGKLVCPTLIQSLAILHQGLVWSFYALIEVFLVHLCPDK